MADDPRTAEPATRRAPQPWTVVLLLFSVTSIVEAIGISQVFAFMPLYLQEMGLPREVVPQWVGVLSALVFVLGLPLVPLWGVWADKYSRKAVIIRSALVEGVVFTLIALSREPWQLAGSFILSGFQLGNSGVMLSAIRDVTPRWRLGTAIALFGSTWPIGSAVGPALGGFLIDGLHSPISTVYLLGAALSLASAGVLAAGFREVRPEVTPTGPVMGLAYGAIRGVLSHPATRVLFAVFGISLLGRQMSFPFLPILVGQVSGSQAGLASAIALVVGTAALVGGLVSPLAGTIGDRVGFVAVLVPSLVGSGVALVLMPFAPTVLWLAAVSATLSVLSGAVSAMVFGLLAEEVPPDRRSATLNLVYLPLYLAGIVGPAMGALIATAGLPLVFVLGGLVQGLAVMAAWRPRG
ncbi:MAG: MFS transporter [Chloroflexota bacterium]